MSARQAFIVTLVVIATAVAAYLAYWLAGTFMLIFGAVILASAIRPAVNALHRRGFHLGSAILLIYFVILVSLVALLTFTVPPLLSLLIRVFTTDLLTEQLRILTTRLALFGWDRYQVLIPVVRLPAQVEAMLAQTGDEVQRQAWFITQNTVVVLGQVVLLFAMTFYWLTSREHALSLLLLLSPREHRQQINTIWTDVENRLGAYVRGQILLMFVIGLLSYLGLLALRVPNAAALALIAGLTEAIPFVGPLLGAVPAVLLALTVSPVTAVLVAGYYLLVQTLESNILVPRIMASNVGLNPLVVIVAIVAGGTLNGIVGALLAIPVAGALQVIVQHVWLTPALEALRQAQHSAPAHSADKDRRRGETGEGKDGEGKKSEAEPELPPPEELLDEETLDPEDLPDQTSGERDRSSYLSVTGRK